MRLPQAPISLLTLALTALLVAFARPSSAAPGQNGLADKQACADASEQGQELRDQGKLLSARARFLACTIEVCPAIIRKDCAAWLADVDERIPSIVLDVQGPDGQDLTRVRVLEAGAVLAETLDGRAISLDPGEHRLRYEWSGAPAVLQRFVLREGEKRRRLSVRFMKAAPPASAATSPLPIAPLVLGGVALAGGAAFAGLAASARSDYDHLDATCAPRCTPEAVDPVRTKLVLANVFFGLSVASLGAAAILWFTRPTAPRAKTTAFAITPLPGGAAAFFGGALPFE